MKKTGAIVLLLTLGSCAPARPRAAEPGSDDEPWILVSRDGALYFERERSKEEPRLVVATGPVEVRVRGPEYAPVGQVVEIEVRVAGPEPGASYLLTARPTQPWIVIVGPDHARVGSEPARFRFVSRVGGRAGLIVEARRDP